MKKRLFILILLVPCFSLAGLDTRICQWRLSDLLSTDGNGRPLTSAVDPDVHQLVFTRPGTSSVQVLRFKDKQKNIPVLETVKELLPLADPKTGAPAPINALDISLISEGTRAVAVASSRFVDVFEPNNGTHQYRLEFKNDVRGVQFSPDGNSLLVWTDSGAGVYTRSTGKPIKTHASTARTEGAQFLKNTAGILTFSHEGTLTLYGPSATFVLRHGTPVAHVAQWKENSNTFTPEKLVSVGKDGSLKFWEKNKRVYREKVVARPDTGNITSVEFSSDGEKLLTASQEGTGVIYNCATQKPRILIDAKAFGEITALMKSSSGLQKQEVVS